MFCSIEMINQHVFSKQAFPKKSSSIHELADISDLFLTRFQKSSIKSQQTEDLSLKLRVAKTGVEEPRAKSKRGARPKQLKTAPRDVRSTGRPVGDVKTFYLLEKHLPPKCASLVQVPRIPPRNSSCLRMMIGMRRKKIPRVGRIGSPIFSALGSGKKNG